MWNAFNIFFLLATECQTEIRQPVMVTFANLVLVGWHDGLRVGRLHSLRECERLE